MFGLREFDTLAFERLVRRAVKAVRYPGVSPAAFRGELWLRAEDPGLGVFAGYDGRTPRALLVALLPSSVMMMAPQVTLAYNEGPPALARLVGAALREWLMMHGHVRFLGMNFWRDDAVFIRGFRHAGLGRKVGSLFEFEVK